MPITLFDGILLAVVVVVLADPVAGHDGIQVVEVDVVEHQSRGGQVCRCLRKQSDKDVAL